MALIQSPHACPVPVRSLLIDYGVKRGAITNPLALVAPGPVSIAGSVPPDPLPDHRHAGSRIIRYIKIEGPKLYGMFVNTLITEEFKGQDLTSKTSIWVKRKHIASQEEAEIKITRQPVTLYAMKDVYRYGKNLKFLVTGPCQLPS